MPHENQHEHERSDVNVPMLVRGLLILAGGLFISMVALAGYWRILRWLDGPSTSRFAEPRELPPRPRLQAAPERDLSQMLERDLGRLNSYGPTDTAGRFHIPIERAMELTVRRGLPARPANKPSAPAKEAANEPAAR